MDVLIWLLVIVLIVAVLAALFAVIRHRQRSGDVLASRPVDRKGGR